MNEKSDIRVDVHDARKKAKDSLAESKISGNPQEEHGSQDPGVGPTEADITERVRIGMWAAYDVYRSGDENKGTIQLARKAYHAMEMLGECLESSVEATT